MARPDFLVVGHVVKDLVPGGWRLGGTAAYASLQAARLDLRTAVVTSAPASMDLAALLPGIEVHRVPSRGATTFRNSYGDGRRTQYVLAQARSLALKDVPDAWRAAAIVLLGPVCGEVSPDAVSLFAGSMVGVSAQGWLREVDAEGCVARCPWPESGAWRSVHAVFVSDDDLAGDKGPLDDWTGVFPMVAYSRASRGACLHVDGRWRHMDAFPEREVDPTRAGDVFAAAFLIRFWESGDAALAARFAAAAASLSVAGEGTQGIADRRQIEGRMARHPEIAMR